MANILRELRRSIQVKGSIRKYTFYAVGEIVLVMLGILLAIQVNNWNEEQIERRIERRMLASLQEDFIINDSLLQDQLDTIQRTLNHTESALDLIPGGPASDLDLIQFLEPYYLMEVTSFEPIDGVLKDIINSGKLDLISNDNLRQAISSWEGIIEDNEEHEQKMIRFRELSMRPFMTECCPMTNSFDFDRAVLFSDYQFETIINQYKWLLMTQVLKRKPLKRLIDEILILIDESLEPLS